MANDRTPGVYVRENSGFPPSVAEVASAIPAFLGYTERADADTGMVPTAITSLGEFESLFGAGPDAEISAVVIDRDNGFESADVKMPDLLHDSLRLFFANGGERCYIVSIGTYGTDPDKQHFTDGLEMLRLEDEPTLLVFPDATRLAAADLYAVQRAALAQCGELKDRFTIMDLPDIGVDVEAVGGFRTGIGQANLAYGAAYVPHLQVNFAKTVRYRAIKGKIRKCGADTPLAALADEDRKHQLKEAIGTLDMAIADVDAVTNARKTVLGDADSLAEVWEGFLDEFRSAAGDDERRSKLATLFRFVYGAAALLDGFTASLANAGKDLARQEVDSRLAPVLAGVNAELATVAPQGTDGTDKILPAAWTSETLETLFANVSNRVSGDLAATDRFAAAATALEGAAADVIDAVDGMIATLSAQETELDDALAEAFPVYKAIRDGAARCPTTLPPSGALAGIYAAVDRSRGCWKAPANVSVAGATGITLRIGDSFQETLNVDTTAGKSINAIRAFPGKGVVVWGARTLAGNDNEWRYIPVRRFFNMVEESVKKSTAWAVFEPNDAKLWTAVRTTIENYLITKWRDGALAGEKPDQAFYVNVGLGKTMTAQDIVNGLLIVDIGLAVVRPAEFIVIRFAQKLQVS